MMRSGSALLFGACVVAGNSCEKVKEAVVEISRSTEAAVAGEEESPTGVGGEIDPRLASLVDETAQGVRFRRDLEFPDRVRCRYVVEKEFRNGRMVSNNLLGRQSGELNGTFHEAYVAERDGGLLTVRFERSSFMEGIQGDDPAPEDGSGPREVGTSEAVGLEGRFVRGPEGWKRRGGGGDFKQMAWEEALAPALDGWVSEWGLVPRSPWFSGTRLSPGDKLALEGGQVGLITGDPSTRGEATLVFERVESVGGHPCAAFRWSGDVSFGNEPAAGAAADDKVDMELSDMELSVDDGTIWCSLIHPLVLRNEYSGVVTETTRDASGNLKLRLQGAVTIRIRWEWGTGD